ncbi:MAG: ATPase, T2SS/T4P/T4SS family [Verrucomicrobiae bacterium]|nr:ATPase, T2SS/T4P/T4SS family [Verrucomicrobiae bacterium]
MNAKPAASMDAAHETQPASAPEVVEELLRRAERAGASDVHIQTGPDGAAISFRLDGLLTPVTQLPSDLAARVVGRIKFLARLKTYQDSLPQEGRIARELLGTTSDLRVATYPTVTGEKIVLRLFQTGAAQGLEELGFPEAAMRELKEFLRKNSGLLLLTGPAGSGKTTTIYACLRHLTESGNRHIITVEDPVERLLPGVMQTEVHEALGLSFAEAARHLLRQDPEVLVIGEVRDEETAGIAVRAALTGHLVISTLHAGSCVGVLERLLVLCADRSAVAAVVELIFNQRLLRRLCAGCGGAGCDACLRSGYRGRVPAVEWLRVDEPMREAIRRHDLSGVAPATSLAAAAHVLVRSGRTTLAECQRVLGV